MSEKLSIVLPKALADDVEALGRLTGEDKSTIVRRLLTKGLEEVKLDLAVDGYVKGKLSLGRGAKLASVSIWRFLDELRNRRVALRYSLEDAEEEIRRLARIGRTSKT